MPVPDEPLPLDKIRKSHFAAFERVRRSGATNMCRGDMVCDLSGLSRRAYLGVRKNYEALMEKRPEVRNPESKKAERD